MKLCSHPGCDRVHKAHGYCDVHYRRLRRGADMDAPIRVTRPGAICSEPGCGKPARTRGKCVGHYSVWLRSQTRPAKPRRVRSEPKSQPKPKAPLVTKADFLAWREQRKAIRGRDRLRDVG